MSSETSQSSSRPAESDERLRWALQAAGGGAWDWDLLTGVAWWSEEMYALWGVPPGTVMRFDNSVAPIDIDDRPCLEQAVARAIAQRTDYQCEFRLHHPSRGRRWMASFGRLQFNAAGQAVRLLGITLDVTERKTADERLRESEEHFRSLVELNPQVTWTADASGKILDFARRWLDWTGLTRDEALGAGWSQVPHPQDLPRMTAAWGESIHTGKPYDIEHRIRLADGSYRWMRSRAFPRLDADGRIIRWYGTTEDIHDRRQAELARRQSDDRFRALADNIPQLAWMTDETGYIHWYNQRWYDYTGTSFESMQGWGWQSVHHPEHVQRVVEKFRTAVAAHQEWEDTFPLRGRDGQYRWFLSRAVPMRDEHGQVGGWFGTNTDITEQRHSQEALQRAKEAAEVANKSKDHLLAVVSHELRTPLNPILALTSYLQASGTLPEELKEDIAVIRRNVEQEARIVDDLLNVTRLNRGKIAVHPEAVDLHALVRTAVGQFESAMQARQIALHWSLADGPMHVWADVGRMQQVFSNLLDNAVKFTSAGGRIGVRTWRADERRVSVEISDSGVGIEPDVLPRLFTPFEQGESAVTRRFGGLGLGLVIVKGIIDLHHGTIAVHSKGRNQGTRFVVELPALPTNNHTPPAPVPAGLSQRRQRILLVEDHPDTQKAMARLLDSMGYHVATASNVADAVAKIDGQPFDLLVSDIGLPDGSGLDVMRALKARGNVPGIALSGYGHEEDLHRSRDAGFREHLIKPVDFDSLSKTLKKLLPDQV